MRDTRVSRSVIVPAFNVAAYIGEALDSALTEDDQGLEIVVIDDASTDGTREVVRSLEDPRIRLFRNAENRGPSASRNRGFREARGDWLAVLDGDDVWKPGRFQRLTKLAEDLGSDLIADDVVLATEELTPTGETAFSRRGLSIDAHRRVDEIQFIDWDLGFLKPIFRRQFIAANSLAYDEDIWRGEDFDFCLRTLLARGVFDIVARPGYLHRAHRGSLSSDRILLFEATETATLRLLERLAPGPDTELRRALSRRARTIHDKIAYNRVRRDLRQRRPGHALRRVFEDPGVLKIAATAALRRARRLR